MAKTRLTTTYVSTLLYIIAVLLIGVGFTSMFFVEFVPASWAMIVVGVLLLPVVYVIKKTKS